MGRIVGFYDLKNYTSDTAIYARCFDHYFTSFFSHALDVCENECLKLCMNLAFAGSLRIGELLGLTWDCVDISEEAIKENRAYLYVNKEVQRVSKKALEELDQKDVIVIFPEERKTNKTVRIMKTHIQSICKGLCIPYCPFL